MMPLGGFRRPPLLDEQYSKYRPVFLGTRYASPDPLQFPHLSLDRSSPLLPPELWLKIIEDGAKDLELPAQQDYRQVDSRTPSERSLFLGTLALVSRTHCEMARPLLYKRIKVRTLAELTSAAEAMERDTGLRGVVEELSVAAKDRMGDFDEGQTWEKWVGRLLKACKGVKSVTISFAGRKFH